MFLVKRVWRGPKLLGGCHRLSTCAREKTKNMEKEEDKRKEPWGYQIPTPSGLVFFLSFFMCVVLIRRNQDSIVSLSAGISFLWCSTFSRLVVCCCQRTMSNCTLEKDRFQWREATKNMFFHMSTHKLNSCICVINRLLWLHSSDELVIRKLQMMNECESDDVKIRMIYARNMLNKRWY